MTTNKAVPWLRIGAESVAIVVSILLAFAIDAWWDGVLDRRAERELLSALAGEFEATQVELKRGHEIVAARSVAAFRLAAFDDQSITQVDLEELTQLYHQATRPDYIDPPTGVLTSAIASGKLSLIRDSELSALLSGWTSRLVDIRNTETDIRNYLMSVHAPEIARRSVVPYGSVPAGENFDEALLELAIQNHLNYVANLSTINRSENEQLQAGTSEILDLIRRELAEN